LQLALSAQWTAEWVALGEPSLPVLIAPDGVVMAGKDAVQRLGRELTRRTVNVEDGVMLD
jgi:hypothetical protein